MRDKFLRETNKRSRYKLTREILRTCASRRVASRVRVSSESRATTAFRPLSYFSPKLEISRSLRTHSSPGPLLTIIYSGGPGSIFHKRYLSILFVRV